MGDHHHGPAQGISRWLFTTNHKDIGTMYLWFSFAMFLLGGSFAMVIRAELFQPGMQLVEPGFLQPDDDPARFGDGLWCHHAVLCGPG
jgi:cytochrome c oxidase subunit 1